MKIKNFAKIFLFMAIAAVYSCSSSSDEEGGGNNGNAVNSITVSSNASFIDIGDTVTFTVRTNRNTDVTAEAVIKVNGTTISGNSYTATETGQFTIVAEYRNLTSAAISITFIPIIESIELVAEDTYNIGERIGFQVLALDSDGNSTDVSNGAELFIDGAASFTGARFISGAVGVMEVYATFEGFTSNTKTVTIEDNTTTPMTYTRRAVIEDYTGTWCGWCPRVSYGIELVKAASDDVAVVAVHGGDEMANAYGNMLLGTFNPGGSYPTAIINRNQEWGFPEPNNVNQVTALTDGTATSGLSIVTARKENNVSFVVSAGFGENLSGAKLVVLLLENGLIYDQENYTSYYGGADVLPNFVHDHVLRYAFGSPMGENISSGELVAGNTYREKFDYTMPSNVISNPGNAEIVAMLVAPNNTVINVNMVKVGEIAEF